MKRQDDFLIAIFCICFSHVTHDFFSDGKFSGIAVFFSGLFFVGGILMFAKGVIPYFKENDYSIKKLFSYLCEAYRTEPHSEQEKTKRG